MRRRVSDINLLKNTCAQKERGRRSASAPFQIIRVTLLTRACFGHLVARAHPAVNIGGVFFSRSIRRNFSRNKPATREGNGNGKSFDSETPPPILSHASLAVSPPLNYFRWVRPTHDQSCMTHIYGKSEILFLYLTYSRWRRVFDIFVRETLIYCFHIDGFHKIRFSNFVLPLNIRG